MKNTILSQKDLALLEQIVLHYSKIVSFEQIQEAIGNEISDGAARKWVAELTQAGWLIRLKKGLYLVVTDISTLGFIDVSELTIAQALIGDSYIAFDAALQYHGMFDQMLARIDSVTKGTTKAYKVGQTIYQFSHIKEDLYFGFNEETLGNDQVKIAHAEKALLDMLYFRTSDYAVSLVLEKLQDYQEELDFARLKAYSLRFSLGTVRKLGFLLDQVGVETADLIAQSNVKENSYNRLTHEADQFNAKWRLYYDSQTFG